MNLSTKFFVICFLSFPILNASEDSRVTDEYVQQREKIVARLLQKRGFLSEWTQYSKMTENYKKDEANKRYDEVILNFGNGYIYPDPEDCSRLAESSYRGHVLVDMAGVKKYERLKALIDKVQAEIELEKKGSAESSQQSGSKAGDPVK